MVKLEERPWWPDLVALKDVLSLRELSSRFGAAPAAISNALKRNNLDRVSAPPGPRDRRDPALVAAAARALREAGDVVPEEQVEGAAPLRGRLSSYRHVIGRRIDREVAEMAGVSVSAVTNYRRRHGIAAATRGGVDDDDDLPDTVPVRSRFGLRLCGRAFRVNIDGSDFVVVAEDIAQAARIACESRRGRVLKVELLGSALAA